MGRIGSDRDEIASKPAAIVFVPACGV
jgi:hypothetical protein